MPGNNTFTIELKDFFMGASPTAHLDSMTEMGNRGHYSSAQNIDVISNPDNLTQGPGLADLTNGTQAGEVDELINFIQDVAVADDVTYGIGVTKLFKISSTTVASGGIWPHVITNATDGESVANLKGNLYYFYNKASGGEIGKYDLSTTFTDAWGSTVPTGAAALENALHPVATKEDLLCFGNGRYLGVFTDSSTTLEPQKLDFGNGHEVADIIFNANSWWIAVNAGVSGTNRNQSQVFLYDGSAISTLLSDETAVGLYRIGWLHVLNGTVYICYQDLSGNNFKIGYIAGRQIIELASFTGSLPNFAQKTLYKNTILFVSSGLIYSVGSVVPNKLPVQISQLADGGFSSVGALAAPFGTPMVASTDGGSNQRLAQFSGYDTACSWRSIVMPISKGALLGRITRITVMTNTLGSGARCDLQLETNMDTADSGTAKIITTANKRRHIFTNFGAAVEDFRVFLDFSSGSASNPVQIRGIFVEGLFSESLG